MLRQPDINNPSIYGSFETLRFVREFRSQRHGLHDTLLNPNEARTFGDGRRKRKEVIGTILNG